MKNLLHVLVIVAIFIGTAPKKAIADHRLRIVTYNVQCLMAPRSTHSKLVRYRWDEARQRHLESVASIIETLEPDILNLVEVTSEESVQRLVTILHEKGLKDYRGYHVESKDGFTGFDVALISRIVPDEVEGQAIRCMFSYADDPQWREKYTFTNRDGVVESRTTSLSRNALYYFTFHGYKLGMLGVHFKSNPSDAYSNGRRTAESLIATRIVQREIVARGYQPIVLGDINDYDPDVPDRDPERSTVTSVFSILKDYDPKAEGQELSNAAAKIERIADRYTSHWDRNENGVADSADVHTMIDHILLPRQFMPFIRRTFVSRVGDLKISDHWPVVVDLNLPPKQATP